MKAYLANGLFTMGDRLVNEMIAQELRVHIPNLDLYVPQENDEINDKTNYASSEMIADGDISKLIESDFLVAVIDGVEIDSGVACEIGMALSLSIPIYALYTDVRQHGRDNYKKLQALVKDGTENQFMYRNLFVIGVIKKSGGNISDNVLQLVKNIRTGMGLD